MKIISLVICSFIVLLSCNKEDETTTCLPLFIAPCINLEKVYDVNTIEPGPSVNLPQAKFRIHFSDSTNPSNNITYGFNKYPTTGKYHMVTFIDTTNQSLPNQIANVKDVGSFKQRSGFAELTQVFVEKNDSDIIISFCDMGDNWYYFVDTIQSYVGNPESLRIRMPF